MKESHPFLLGLVKTGQQGAAGCPLKLAHTSRQPSGLAARSSCEGTQRVGSLLKTTSSEADWWSLLNLANCLKRDSTSDDDLGPGDFRLNQSPTNSQEAVMKDQSQQKDRQGQAKGKWLE